MGRWVTPLITLKSLSWLYEIFTKLLFNAKNEKKTIITNRSRREYFFSTALSIIKRIVDIIININNELIRD